MTSKQKKTLLRIIVSFVLFIALAVAFHGPLKDYEGTWFEGLFFLVPYAIIGYDIFVKAIKNIINGQVFDENFLMVVAGLGAYGTKEFSEAVAVMLFYQVGELFQSYAVGKSRQSIADLMNIAPEFANIMDEEGNIEEVDPDEVEIGSIILIRPGEKIPLDGVVIEGESFVDTAALTGESVPRRICEGKDIISGCINGSGTLKVQTTKAYEDSTVSRILELVENASSKKSKTENFITKFAKYYTPIVTIGAVLLAVIPSIITGNWAEWIGRACTFLVISCPCALVISVPMGFFGGIGAASKIGVLVKGSNYLETLSKLTCVAFDKTGTLTQGKFVVTCIKPHGISEGELLELAAKAEKYSTHPIADSVSKAYAEKNNKDADVSDVSDYIEVPGMGIAVRVGSKQVFAGNEKLMQREGIEFEKSSESGTVIYIAEENTFRGSVVISDIVKRDAGNGIKALKRSGVLKTVMLTGDRLEAASSIANELGIDELHADLMPADKVACVETLIDSLSENQKLAFVGDGINDAPVLTRADVGIAMGSLGSDSAIEAADVVIMDDNISKIAAVITVAGKTLRIVRENIVFALGVKFAVLILGAFGFASMWVAVFADVGVAVLAILNSMRALKVNL